MNKYRLSFEGWGDQGWTQHDLVGGSTPMPTAELCRSCVPPAHQLLYWNCNCCSQFTCHHVITQITVSHFVFFDLSWKIAPPLHPLWPGLGTYLQWKVFKTYNLFGVPLRITLFLLYSLVYTVSYLFKCICRLRNIK
jgi:hypothetical protein